MKKRSVAILRVKWLFGPDPRTIKDRMIVESKTRETALHSTNSLMDHHNHPACAAGQLIVLAFNSAKTPFAPLVCCCASRYPQLRHHLPGGNSYTTLRPQRRARAAPGKCIHRLPSPGA